MRGPLQRALAERFALPEWAIFFEVANGTGGHARRRADAVAMNLWPSRGLVVWGFECKSDRGDWLREIKAPAKAEEVAQYCDAWFVVARTADIVRPGELPPRWGLFVLDGTKLTLAVEAHPAEPQPLARAFVAAILRRTAERQAEHDRQVEESGFERGIRDGPTAWQTRNERLSDALKELTKRVRVFEAASGVEISAYGTEHIGAAAKTVLETRRYGLRIAADLDAARERLQRAVEDLAREATMYRALVAAHETPPTPGDTP